MLQEFGVVEKSIKLLFHFIKIVLQEWLYVVVMQ
jgi:hypothetical protein